MSEPTELRGLISKLEETYAYATTDQGNVFIPIAAARVKNETLISLKDKFSYNEEIRMTVIRQPGRKNNCAFQAKTVRKSENSASTSRISDEIFGPLIAQVTSTTDSYAFAYHDELGTIFVPGDAFDSKIVKSVSGYINPKNQLMVKIKEQIERKGCKWVAVEAVKQYVIDSKQDDEEDKNATPIGDMIVSIGVVIDVESLDVQVLDEANNFVVHCPILTYTGGIRGLPGARNLFDVVKGGDNVMFKAIHTQGMRFDAIEWKHIGDSQELVIPKKVATSDSFVQTPVDLVTVLFRKLLEDHPEDIERYHRILEKIPDSALPDCYLMARDTNKYTQQPWQ